MKALVESINESLIIESKSFDYKKGEKFAEWLNFKLEVDSDGANLSDYGIEIDFENGEGAEDYYFDDDYDGPECIISNGGQEFDDISEDDADDMESSLNDPKRMREIEKMAKKVFGVNCSVVISKGDYDTGMQVEVFKK